MTLTQEQKKAIEILKSGSNVHLYGNAGTGKTFVLKHFLKGLSETRRKETLVLAPTGIAAINLGGSTIHRALNAPIGPISPDDNVKNGSSKMQYIKTIIIDEISMCRFDLFDYVVRCKEQAEDDYKKKIQIIVVGDMLQLPPVMTSEDQKALEAIWGRSFSSSFPFEADAWDRCKFVNVHLTQVKRQNDRELIENENLARVGDCACLDWFGKHTARKLFPQTEGITLVGYNREALAINNDALKNVKKLKTYTASIQGEVRDADKVAPDAIKLAPGVRIISLVNGDGYQNGSLGTVTKTNELTVEVKFDNGCSTEIVPFEWSVKKYEVVENRKTHKKSLDLVPIGTYKQLPLKLGYAITIHKSQGQTYDKVNLHPRCFASGQLYVGLSRCVSSKGLYIEGDLKPEYLFTSQDAVEFYKKCEG